MVEWLQEVEDLLATDAEAAFFRALSRLTAEDLEDERAAVLLLASAIKSHNGPAVAQYVDLLSDPIRDVNVRINAAVACGQYDPERAAELLMETNDLLAVGQLTALAPALEDNAALSTKVARYIWEHTGDLTAAARAVVSASNAGDKGAARNLALEILAADDLPEGLRARMENLLGAMFKDDGRTEDAVRYFMSAFARTQDTSYACNALMTANYVPGVSHEEYSLMAQRSVGEVAEDAYTTYPWQNPRLRVGFIGGDFYTHVLSALFSTILEALPNSCDYYLYYTRPDENAGTERFRTRFSNFRNIANLSDVDRAQVIHEDQIDVLIDLAGHTALNGLEVLRRMPARLQVGWLSGMMCPACVPYITHYLCDAASIPDIESLGPQRVVPLGAAFSYNTETCIQEAPGPAPVEINGYVTFGSTNNICKIHRQTLGAWAEILQRVPDSRLRIKVGSRFARHTILRFYREAGLLDRLDIQKPLPSHKAVQRLYRTDIDILLDTWPCGGCVTTLEALWQGCPVVTLRGPTFSHRQSWAVISHLGDADELVADSLSEYIDKAVSLANNVARQRELRKTLRSKLQQSHLCNPQYVATQLIETIQLLHEQKVGKDADIRQTE